MISSFSGLLSMLSLYSTTIVAGVLCAAALSLLGLHLAAREKGAQVLCVAQGSTVGALLGLLSVSLLGLKADNTNGMGHTSFVTQAVSLFPYAAALITGGTTHFMCEFFLKKYQVSRSTFFVAFFASLWAFSHLIVALTPLLESHSAQAYFGDLATLSSSESILGASLGLVSLTFLFGKRFKIADGTFELSLYGTARKTRLEWVFSACTLVMICFSVQFLGLVFTLSALFLAPVVLSAMRGRNFHSAQLFVFLANSSSTFLGFLISLHWTFLPTVPSILASNIVVCFGLAFFKKVLY